MNKPILSSLIFTFFLCCACTASARELVLTTSSADTPTFTHFEIRKLFLGLPVTKEARTYGAIRNSSNEDAYQIFLQKFVRLSAKNYERKLLSRKFRSGSTNVLAADTTGRLVKALQKDALRISFIWKDEIPKDSQLVIIQTLWKSKS